MKGFLKALAFVVNLALVWVTMLAFIEVGQVLVGLVVAFVLTSAIGYVVTDLL